MNFPCKEGGVFFAMLNHRFSSVVFSLGLCAVLAASCSSTGGDQKEAGQPESSAPVASGDQEVRLRAMVSDYIRSSGQPESGGHAKLVERKPYYFKEYSVYTGGPDAYTLEIQEKESKTAPYSAVVKIDKQRFATRMYRARDDAAADNNFLRDTGSETITFEFRNGRWWRAGSLFVAQKTEEHVNGEWVPAKEEVDQAVASEEQDSSWWDRAWYAVTGK